MRYLSVFSGIEAATVAWHPLGWTPVGYAEVDPFASMVLHHHYSSGRPMFMPNPADGVDAKDVARRKAAIRAVKRLPERANGVPKLRRCDAIPWMARCSFQCSRRPKPLPKLLDRGTSRRTC